MNSKVFAKIPKSGLGNCLLVWAHALVFARTNNLELVVSRWSRYRWGAIFRRERKNRRYNKYFKETALLKLLFYRLRLSFSERVYDPIIPQKYNLSGKQFIFTKSVQHKELFKFLRPDVDLIRNELFQLLTPKIQQKFDICDAPEIGVHIRRGDFKNGNPITPVAFFIFIINSIRNANGADLSVTIFTDARPDEIKEVFDLPNVRLSDNKEDILDILQMSQSRFLILSRSSSFSYWAAFLSNAVVYMDSMDWQEKIKDKRGNYREARIDMSSVK